MEEIGIGDLIDNRYEVCRVCGGKGKSGMGIVFLCYDPVDHKPLAIKSVQINLLSKSEAVHKFKEESRMWLRFGHHPHLVEAYWYKEIGTRPFLALEMIKKNDRHAASLAGWIRHKALSVKDILEVSVQICSAMEHANEVAEKAEETFIHRDLSTGNVLMTYNMIVKLSDFGLSLLTGNEGELADARRPGTPSFMSPEQCRGEALDVRADIYSFGCILYEMLSGKKLFGDIEKKDIVNAQMHRDPLPIVPLYENTPKSLIDIAYQCISKDRKGRPDDFSALRFMLEDLYAGMHGHGFVPDPGAFNEKVHYGAVLSELGKYKDAESTLLGYLKSRPEDVFALRFYGDTLREMGRANEALMAYERAMALDKKDPDTYNGRAFVYESMEKYELAVRDYSQAISLNGSDSDSYNNRAMAYRRIGDIDRAIADFTMSIEISPHSSVVFYNRANAHVRKGDLKRAIEDYSMAVRIFEGFGEAYANRGMAYLKGRRPALALSDFRKSLEYLSAKDPKTAKIKGLVARMTGKKA